MSDLQTDAADRRYREARQDAEERAALAEIGRIATSSSSVAEVYEQCAVQIRRLFPFDRLSVSMIESDRLTSRVTYTYSAAVENRLPVGAVFPLKGSIFEPVLRTGQGNLVEVTDESVLDAYPVLVPLVKSGLRSFLAVALRQKGETFAVLGAAAAGPSTYSDRHLKLAQQVADQIAGPVANASLFALAEQRRVESEMLAAVGRIVSSSLDSNQVYRECARLLRGVMPFDTFVVASVDRRRGQRRIEYWEGTNPEGTTVVARQSLAGTMTNRALEIGSAVLERVDEETLDRFPGTAISVNAGFRAMLCAPLRVSDTSFGAIHLRSFDHSAYDESHLDLIDRFALQIAPAIQNARLHEATTKEKEQRALVAEERARRVVVQDERDELLKIAEARKKFLLLVTHELKTPLSATKGFIELLKANRTGNLTPRQLKQLDAALGSTHHLDMMVSDLLDLSRIDAGTFRLEMRRIDLKNVISETAETLGPIFERRRQRLIPVLPGAECWLSGDPARIGQVISNLLSNASKFSPLESEIRIAARHDPDHAVIEVSDNGIGMTAQDIASVGTPFFRADNRETRAVPGTGLGLYIADSIIRLHDGSLTVTSERGAGSTFTVRLPVNHVGRSPAIQAGS